MTSTTQYRNEDCIDEQVIYDVINMPDGEDIVDCINQYCQDHEDKGQDCCWIFEVSVDDITENTSLPLITVCRFYEKMAEFYKWSVI